MPAGRDARESGKRRSLETVKFYDQFLFKDDINQAFCPACPVPCSRRQDFYSKPNHSYSDQSNSLEFNPPLVLLPVIQRQRPLYIYPLLGRSAATRTALRNPNHPPILMKLKGELTMSVQLKVRFLITPWHVTFASSGTRSSRFEIYRREVET